MKRSTGLASTIAGCPTSTNLNWCILFPARGLSSLISDLVIIQAPKGNTRTQESVIFFVEKSQLLTPISNVASHLYYQHWGGLRQAQPRLQRQTACSTDWDAEQDLVSKHKRPPSITLAKLTCCTGSWTFTHRVLQSPLDTYLRPSLNHNLPLYHPLKGKNPKEIKEIFILKCLGITKYI